MYILNETSVCVFTVLVNTSKLTQLNLRHDSETSYNTYINSLIRRIGQE
jgi:hypothetical protein